MGEFNYAFNDDMIITLLKLFQEYKKEEKNSSLFLWSRYYIPKANTRLHQKRNNRLILLLYTDINISNKFKF